MSLSNISSLHWQCWTHNNLYVNRDGQEYSYGKLGYIVLKVDTDFTQELI